MIAAAVVVVVVIVVVVAAVVVVVAGGVVEVVDIARCITSSAIGSKGSAISSTTGRIKRAKAPKLTPMCGTEWKGASDCIRKVKKG